jgi:hypothetical protein
MPSHLPKTEKGMVRRATPLVFAALRLSRSECVYAHELTVGPSIADLVILRARDARFWPSSPLSMAECAVLSFLRHHGAASVDTIAHNVFMRAENVHRLLLGRLSRWSLVRTSRLGQFRAPAGWVAKSELVAVEAKLIRWREALDQAVVYRRYADRAYVLLPKRSAAIAARHKDLFLENGVGLLSYDAGGVYRVFSGRKTTEHTWHREFAISRVR